MQAPFSTQGLNLYSYVFNNPVNNTDPSGFEVSAGQWAGFGAFTAADVGLMLYASGAFTGGTAAGASAASAGAGSTAGTIGGAIGSGLANVGVSLLFGGPLDGSAPAGPTQAVPTGARASRTIGTGTGSPHSAVGQRTPLEVPVQEKPANLSLFAPERGAVACGPVCYLPNPEEDLPADAQKAMIRGSEWSGAFIFGGAD